MRSWFNMNSLTQRREQGHNHLEMVYKSVSNDNNGAKCNNYMQ
jgi:hypothetical protein